MHYLAKMFGYWPSCMIGDATKQSDDQIIIESKLSDYIWHYMAFFCYIICTYSQWCSTVLMESLNYSSIEVLMNMVTMVSSGAIAIVATLISMINRTHIWQIILAFHRFDQTVCTRAKTRKYGNI